MKRLNLVFVLCLLFVGQPLYGQWYFNYMCGLSNLQKQGGYPTKSACEAAAAAMDGRPCDNGSGGLWGSHINVAGTSGNCCSGTDLPVSTADGQTRPGMVDFNKIQQITGVVPTNPYDEMIDGKEENLYWKQAMFGKTQNTFTAQTGDKAYDEAYAWIGKLRTPIYKKPSDLKVNMDIQKGVSSPTIAMPNLQNENGKWNDENSNQEGIYTNAKEYYNVGDYALNWLNETVKPVFDLLNVKNPLQNIVDKKNEAEDINTIVRDISEGDYSTFTEKVKGFVVEEGKNIASTIADNYSTLSKTIGGCLRVGKVLINNSTDLTKKIFGVANKIVNSNFEYNPEKEYKDLNNSAGKIPGEGFEAWFNKNR